MTTQAAAEPETFDDFAGLDEQIKAAKPAGDDAKKSLVEAAGKTAVAVADARQMRVQTPGDADAAAEFLSFIGGLRKSNEAERKTRVAPLVQLKKAIDDGYKQTDAPLEQAFGIVRGRLLEFRSQEERKAAEEQARRDAEAAAEQARIDAAREAAEAQARAEREAAEAAAAEAARVAAEQERARQEEIAKNQAGLAARAAKTPEARLRELVAADGTPDDVRAACKDALDAIERRRAAEEAEAQARAAREREAEQLTAQTQVVVAERVEAPSGPIRTSAGSVSTRKTWKATVTDEKLVPRQFLVVDQVAVNKFMRELVEWAGTDKERQAQIEGQIPGVRIHQEAGIAVR